MIDNQTILYKFIQTNNNVNWPSISYKYKLSEDETDFSKKRLSLWNNVKVKKLVKGWLKCDYRR